MNKQEQIEEIKQVLIKTCKRCRTFEEDYMQSKYAKELYNAGYRKTFTNDIATDTQNAFKEGYDKAHKETAKEILTYLWKQRNVIGQLMIFEEDLIKLARQYGVEVEE